MCGISGIFLKQRQTLNLSICDEIKKMVQIQSHRGPDAKGLWVSQDKSVGFGHNRLAIIDLTEAGNQPMHSTDGRYTIVFNGQIYNYIELKTQLSSLGSQFQTNSDTEVLLEAYRHWGEAMLEKLRGMFAFALYDQTIGIVFCARDRVGKKPFVYAKTEQGFAFASEIPAIRQVQGVDVIHDHNAVAAMLLHNLRHIPDPYTAYRGIKRLRAGHAMRIRQGKIEKIWRYWNPAPSSTPITPKNLRHIIEDSVALRMRADVPVGALLSGGVDSSAIVAMMQQHVTQPVRTYALGYNKDDEDLQRARQMASKLGTDHKEFYFDPTEQWKLFNKLQNVYGEPIMLLPLIHTYVLCQAIHDDGIKVVLTGNGADELFYGYTGHTRTLRISRGLDYISPLRPLLSPLKNTAFAWLGATPGVRKAAYYSAISQSSWKNCLSSDAIASLINYAAEEMHYWGALCPSEHYIDESNFVGLMVENTHSVTIAGDLPAMAASVEARAPFLDHEIVNFALATPAQMKIPNVKNKDWLKAILREAVGDLIPETLLKAPKRGFGSGIQEADLLNGEWNNYAMELLQNPNDCEGLFSKAKIKALWPGFQKGKIPAALLMKQLSIQVWLESHV